MSHESKGSKKEDIQLTELLYFFICDVILVIYFMTASKKLKQSLELFAECFSFRQQAQAMILRYVHYGVTKGVDVFCLIWMWKNVSQDCVLEIPSNWNGHGCPRRFHCSRLACEPWMTEEPCPRLLQKDHLLFWKTCWELIASSCFPFPDSGGTLIIINTVTYEYALIPCLALLFSSHLRHCVAVPIVWWLKE